MFPHVHRVEEVTVGVALPARHWHASDDAWNVHVDNSPLAGGSRPVVMAAAVVPGGSGRVAVPQPVAPTPTLGAPPAAEALEVSPTKPRRKAAGTPLASMPTPTPATTTAAARVPKAAAASPAVASASRRATPKPSPRAPPSAASSSAADMPPLDLPPAQPLLGEDGIRCGLCAAGYKNGDKWRKVRQIHIHWFNVMESGTLCHVATGRRLELLSEWTAKELFKRWARANDLRVSSHFKCFSHAALVGCFASGSTEVQVHKHCLHAFNFVVKARYEDLVAATGYVPGPHPDDFGGAYAKRDLDAALVFDVAHPEVYVPNPRAISRLRAPAPAAAPAAALPVPIAAAPPALPAFTAAAAAAAGAAARRRPGTPKANSARSSLAATAAAAAAAAAAAVAATVALPVPTLAPLSVAAATPKRLRKPEVSSSDEEVEQGSPDAIDAVTQAIHGLAPWGATPHSRSAGPSSWALPVAAATRPPTPSAARSAAAASCFPADACAVPVSLSVGRRGRGRTKKVVARGESPVPSVSTFSAMSSVPFGEDDRSTVDPREGVKHGFAADSGSGGSGSYSTAGKGEFAADDESEALGWAAASLPADSPDFEASVFLPGTHFSLHDYSRDTGLSVCF
jgi:hypothetical protein